MMDFCLNRREFIKRSGLLFLGLTSGVLLPNVSEAVRLDRKRYKVSRTNLLIGTVVSITVVDESKDKADDAIGAAFEEIKRLEGLFTRFDSKSPVGMLNNEGRLNGLPPELISMVRDSIKFNKLTHGAFDITVKPVLDLYEGAYKKGTLPKEEEISNAIMKIGTEYIQIEGTDIAFQKHGMAITLDGIAKGFIVDKASERISQLGVRNHLINAGGDIRVSGERKEGGPWKIAIQDPKKGKDYPDVISLSQGAIATSGNYEVFFDNERLFHHIVDPQSGKSPLELDSVSVVASSCKEADALSTALFVMGPSKAKGFEESYPCQYLLITRDGKVSSSKGWNKIKA
mgnify:CR=1 FL=1